MPVFKSIEWLDEQQCVRLLDQKVLPHDELYVDCSSVDEVARAIDDMTVRGAPAIGVAAAYGLAIAAICAAGDVAAAVTSAADFLRTVRPTAVNLMWAIDEAQRRIAARSPPGDESYRQAVLAIAHELAEEDVATNLAIGDAAAPLFGDRTSVIHHCNTGSIATIDYGTALGTIRLATERGKSVFVYVDETRPRLQGARLTCWELQKLGVPHQLIVDGASGHVMRDKDVDFCLVGCDRVAANGDVANKIGTFNLAIAAKYNNVPFYVAAPMSTIDRSTPSGADIEIEERDADEVGAIDGQPVTPPGVDVYNPAFDVTPAELITGIITEKGIVRPPYSRNLAKLWDS